GKLSTQDGLVFRDDRFVIPDSLQEDITQRIHSSHLGDRGMPQERKRLCIPARETGIQNYCNTPVQGLDTSQDKHRLKTTLNKET
ncbi:hypothetical protein ILYODFUR_033943, partial [Ilyodon furcidens]